MSAPELSATISRLLLGRELRCTVTTFQRLAPSSPEQTTQPERTAGPTTPLAIVAATVVPNTTKAMKLNIAAHATTTRGESTRVATTVAIALAASWNPLVQSNASAIPITATTANVSTEVRRA